MAITDLESVTLPATGETIATRTINAKVVQVVMPIWGNAADQDYVRATTPWPVGIYDADGNRLVFASDITIEATPSIDAGAYADLDNLDGAIISWASATATAAGSGYIDHVQIIDKSGQGGTSKNMMIAFCRSSITPNAQNAAFTLTDSQMEEVVTRVTTVDADWYNMGGGSMAEVDVSPPRPFQLASGTTLYGVVKLLGAFTFGATTDVIIRVHIVRN